MPTDNFRKHTTKNPFQKFLINRFFNVLVEELRGLHPDTILDVGCGEGFTLERIRQHAIGEKLEGIDIQQQAVDMGHTMYPHLRLAQGSVYQLPYGDSSFDAVVCTEVLEHLEHPEKAIKELYRVTRNYSIISVPNEPFFQAANFLRGKNIKRWGNDIEHIQHWSKKDITNLVGRYFNVRTVRTSFPWTLIVGGK